MTTAQFRKLIYAHYQKYERHFSWRETTNPYRIVISEVMLQQTQASRVVNKYLEFIKRFPNFGALAKASLRDVLNAWQGLGYNRRALALKKLAQEVVRKYEGKLPSNPITLVELPSIGPNTAGSIAAFAFNQPVVFIETNIRTVFLHCFFPTRSNVTDQELLPLIEKTLDRKNPRQWYYALMDYGVFLKQTIENPSRRSKHFSQQSKFAGSHRQIRGLLLKALLVSKKSLTVAQLSKVINKPISPIKKAVEELVTEGLLVKRGERYGIKR